MENIANTVKKPFSDINLPDTSQLTNTIKNTFQDVNLPDTSQLTNTLKNTVDSASSGVSNTLGQFSSPSEVNGSSDFLNTNSLIAKFVFLILVLVGFLFLVNLGILLIGYFMQPSQNPYIIKGLVPGNSNIVISQNPNNSSSVLIKRSNNRSKGIEASWSVWLFISDLNGGSGSEYNHIFSKGNNEFDAISGIANVNNAPGLYLNKTDNTLRVYMDTVVSNAVYMDITNIPLKKWFHLVIRIENNVMDAYVNGTIAKRQKFNDVVKQNYDNILIGANGGFNGQLSNLVYYSRALSVFDINNIILAGPSLVQSSEVKSNLGYYSYLSNIWYSQKYQEPTVPV
jgi:Concanavalin A-like lectin/glucanases superfamily